MKHSIALPLLLAIVGCSSAPEEGSWDNNKEDSALLQPADQSAPPPVAASLTVGTTVAGGQVTIRASSFPPGTVVNFIASANTTAPGLCPPAIAPTCLAVPAGFISLGTATANASGIATIVRTLPNPAPPRLEFQAYGARAGTYYLSNGVISTVYTATGDQDGDGLQNLAELTGGTDPLNADSDGDGVGDGAELAAGTNPLDADSDDDTLTDGDEASLGTDPLNPDTDADTLSDADELAYGTNPLSADSDGDGLGDAQELAIGTQPTNPDTDADGLSDGIELIGGTDPLSADSDGDGLTDGTEDADYNGFVGAGETSPTNPDTDADGVGDGAEYASGTDPLLFDTDGDGLSDDELAAYGTDPLNPDTDGGSVSDGNEITNGTNPLNAVDDIPAVCGDGVLQPGEDCDDGNTADGDTCPSNCLYVRETEPNNSAATSNGPFSLPVSVYSAITPVADHDFLAFTVPAWADVRIETFDGPGATCVGVDTKIYLYGPDGITALANDDDDSTNTCSLLQPSTDAAVRHMAPGTYFLDVTHWNNTGLIPQVRTSFTFDALCGDGIVAGSEECEGGATCDAECQRIPTCGDTFIDAPETCDDGNTASGDGCSATCILEGVSNEIEPNETLANADANTSLWFTSPTVFSGAATPATDKDYYRFDVAAPQVVTFETFETVDPTLTFFDVTSTTFTTSLFLFNAAGTSQTTDSSVATGGIRSASALSWPFETPGPYYIQVEEAGRNATLASYKLKVEYPPAFGAEAEPNDAIATATPLLGASGWVSGNHTLNADLDYYSITVPAGASLRLETIEGDRAVETCESNGIDSYIYLYNPAGTQIAADDDGARGWCSLVDGTGSVSQQATGAHALPAGTYSILVKSNSTTAGGVFDYKLIWKIRTP